MSFDLAVLALPSGADATVVRQMFDRCGVAAADHRDGEPDSRITAFYEQVQAVCPDHGPHVDVATSPWSSTPLDVGIDHVFVRLRHGSDSTPAIDLILSLASRHRLAVHDPQSDDSYLP